MRSIRLLLAAAPAGLLHHSDRGSQYTSKAYRLFRASWDHRQYVA